MIGISHLEKIQVVALDWDGTVVDSVPYKIAQNQAVAREFGRDLSTDEVRREWNAAAGFPDLMYRLTGSQNMDEIMAVVRRDYDNPAYAKRNFEFARTALAAMRADGYKLAIITNATREILQMDAAALGFDLEQDFDFTQAADEWEFKKPDARVFDPVLEQFGIVACQLLYAGDEMKDYWGAKNAGAAFVGVATGMVTPEEFRDEDIPYAENLQSLANQLRR